MQAKVARSVDQALPQLLVYLASLHQSRLQRGRSDASVYGAVSDGFAFRFVMITHDGAVKLSKLFEINQGDMAKVLGCFKYILDPAVSIEGEHQEDDDPALDPDDNDYLYPLDDQGFADD